jgi:hypothetical protein
MLTLGTVVSTCFYLVVTLGSMAFLKFVLGITFETFISTILAEMGLLASKVNSPPGLNALVLVMMFILILVFYGSYIAREIYEVLKIFREGVEGEQQAELLGLFSVSLLGGAGLLSTVAARP